MPASLTKSNVEILEVRFWKVEEDDGQGGTTTKWWASVGYRVNTTEGESWPRTLQPELAGAIETKTAALYADIQSYIESQEGL